MLIRVLGVLLSFMGSIAVAQEDPGFRVRDGYQVTVASVQMEETRFMEFDDQGTLYVSSPNRGEVTSMRDTDDDGVYEIVATYMSGYPQAHGMDFHDGWLWVTQSTAIHKTRDTDGDGVADDIVTVLDDLPGGGGHWWRPIFVTDDGFFTSVGDSGNINEDLEDDRQELFFYSLDGTEKTFWSSGVRNTEKYGYRPGTTELWGIDHNSDWYGKPLGEDNDMMAITDEIPPGEVNLYVQDGFYGHPYIVGNNLPRIEFFEHENILEFAQRNIKPEWNLQAHSAVNGWCFLDESDHFPADHQGDMFMAAHGSWNSSIKVGYSVDRLLFDDLTGKPYGMLRIVSTMTRDDLPAQNRDGILARPVDVVQAPDGTLLFSCDYTHKIYRITYVGSEVERAY